MDAGSCNHCVMLSTLNITLTIVVAANCKHRNLASYDPILMPESEALALPCLALRFYNADPWPRTHHP